MTAPDPETDTELLLLVVDPDLAPFIEAEPGSATLALKLETSASSPTMSSTRW